MPINICYRNQQNFHAIFLRCALLAGVPQSVGGFHRCKSARPLVLAGDGEQLELGNFRTQFIPMPFTEVEGAQTHETCHHHGEL